MRWVLSFCLYTIAAQADEPALELIPKQVRQGQVALLRVASDAAELKVQLGEQVVPLWQCGKQRCGLVSVPLDTPVGAVQVSVGERSLPLLVKKGKFRVNKLSVDPSLTSPSEEEKKRIEQDKKDIDAAYAQGGLTPLWEGTVDLPTSGGVTSFFGNQRMYNNEVKSTHFGVDLKAGLQTPIQSIAAGKVLLARGLFMAGNLVLVDHGAGFFSSYAHLSTIEVAPEQILKKGDKIGMAGATGRVTGPHLHWGTRVNGVPVDPHSVRDALNSAVSKKVGKGRSVSLKR